MLWLLSTKSSLKGVPVGKGSSVRVSKVLGRVSDDLRYLTTRPVQVGKVTRPALDVLLDRAHQVIAVGLSVSADIDGWSATAPMNGSPGAGKGGGRTMPIHAPTGTDHVPTSSTEASAFARLSGAPSSDSAAGIAAKMIRDLGVAQKALLEVDRGVQRFDRLRSTKDLAEAPQCHVAQVICGLPYDPMWEPFRSTDFAGLIDPPWPEPRRVCSPVYWFVRNNRHLHRLPNGDELRSWLERGSSKVRAS